MFIYRRMDVAENKRLKTLAYKPNKSCCLGAIKDFFGDLPPGTKILKFNDDAPDDMFSINVELPEDFEEYQPYRAAKKSAEIKAGRMNTAEKISTPNGMTIKELKKYLEGLRETNSSGEDFEVWFSTEPGISNLVKSIWPLNKRDEGSDLLLSTEEAE